MSLPPSPPKSRLGGNVPKSQPKYTYATKAYKNVDFLNSNHARFIRIMCEYEETMYRLKANNVRATVLFFGSARAKSPEEWIEAMTDAEYQVSVATTPDDKEQAEKELEKLRKAEWLSTYYDKVVELSRRITEWAVNPLHSLTREHSITGVTRYHAKTREGVKQTPSYSIIPENDADMDDHDELPEQALYVNTGGGPGFMEAANKGASQVPNARNAGMGITLPFEAGLNEYVNDELAFEFHYFFTRKFMMVYHCQALIVAPGGFGTLDELFEVLTLKQTGKVQKDLPVLLLGTRFWKSIINFESLVEFGVVSQQDVDSLVFCDDVDEAFEYITNALSSKSNNLNSSA